MKKHQNQRRSNCPITFTTGIIGDRWAILIVRDILFKGKVSFGDFANSDEGIASNILADRLRRLEDQGIILKSKDNENLTKYVYSLTDKGMDLLPIMVEMIAFAGKYDAKTGAPKKILSQIKVDREKFINEMREHYESGRDKKVIKN